MKLSIGCDHGGYELKEIIVAHLKKLGHEVIDCGTNSLDSCHYPIFAFKAAELVGKKEVERGFVVCTTGEGVLICANKVKGVRCSLAYNPEAVSLTRQHNDANMISIGAKYTSVVEALNYVEIFLQTEFLGDRHLTRVDLIKEYEERHMK